MLCFFPDLLPFTYLLDRVELWNQVPALGAHLGRFFLRSASLASSVNENWSAKALWKVPELWKNQKTVFPQLLGPSVHTSHNAGCCGPSSNTTFLLLPYEDFGSTLAAEHLASDDGLNVHAETLRRWRKEA